MITDLMTYCPWEKLVHDYVSLFFSSGKWLIFNDIPLQNAYFDVSGLEWDSPYY